MAKDIASELDEFEKGQKGNISDELSAFEMARTPKEPTLEEQMGFGRFYGAAEPTLKAASVLAKPYSSIVAPSLELATEGPEAAKTALSQELSQVTPTEKSSVAYQVKKITGMDQPIMESPEKTLTQEKGKFDLISPRVQAAAKYWMQQNFPKAYGFASKVSPADVIGGAADIGAGEAISPITSKAISVPAGKLAKPIMESSINNAEKAIERMSSLSGENAYDASNALKTRKSAITAMEYNLTKDLSDPQRLTQRLNGSKAVVPDQLTGKKVISTSPGLIDELTGIVNEISGAMSEETPKANVKEIGNKVYDNLSSKIADPNSGAPWSPEIASNLQNKINGFFKTGAGQERDFKSLIKLKRAAADKVYEINKDPAIYGVEGATDKAMYKEIWNQIDNYVNNLAKSGDEGAQALVKYNSDLSDLLHLKNMTQGARVQGLSTLSLPEMAIGTGVGMAAGSTLGHPGLGLAYPAVRAGMKMGETNIPSYMAPHQQNIAESLYRTGSGANQMAKLPGRIAQTSISLSHPNFKNNLPMQLVSYQIPRNSDQILQNKDIVSAKIAQMSGDPNITDMVNDTLNNHPEKLKDMLPGLVLKFPNLFENDKYNRIDGHIIDPVMRQKALKDISNDHTMSIREKALKSKRLAEEGILE